MDSDSRTGMKMKQYLMPFLFVLLLYLFACLAAQVLPPPY